MKTVASGELHTTHFAVKSMSAVGPNSRDLPSNRQVRKPATARTKGSSVPSTYRSEQSTISPRARRRVGNCRVRCWRRSREHQREPQVADAVLSRAPPSVSKSKAHAVRQSVSASPSFLPKTAKGVLKPASPLSDNSRTIPVTLGKYRKPPEERWLSSRG